ncbi:NUDIX domain-containing protein [Sedimenticola hydrogenitrophicus]|uniref:NUDIX domain-containing protein n=1 Tax=Sedimenticola hydrogenitrophicus TaxID=2967975 RepID=UPI0023AFD53D
MAARVPRDMAIPARFIHNDAMADKRLKANILETRTEYAGFFELRRLTVEHDRFDGGTTGPLVREVLHRSDVVAALLHDPTADKVVLVEQYRAGAHVAGLSPWLVDIVAGRIETGQTPLQAITREITEESGLIPVSIKPIGTYLTAPHLSSEQVHLYCATVDATAVAGYHGLAREGEDIRPLVLERTEALGLLKSRPLSLWAGLALGWLGR